MARTTAATMAKEARWFSGSHDGGGADEVGELGGDGVEDGRR